MKLHASRLEDRIWVVPIPDESICGRNGLITFVTYLNLPERPNQARLSFSRNDSPSAVNADGSSSAHYALRIGVVSFAIRGEDLFVNRSAKAADSSMCSTL